MYSHHYRKKALPTFPVVAAWSHCRWPGRLSSFVGRRYPSPLQGRRRTPFTGRATEVRSVASCQGKMKKGIHPQLQWISYVTQSGRLMNVTMTKIHQVGKVYHFRAKRQMAQSIGQIAKFKRRYGGKEEEPEKK
ncbi:Ribosomal protein L31 [Striga hermonthica]|uniref:Ribosomal protein L31 n=1 Tax=Striga hermonthica TaxID=68872 RepID=A0A9N7P2N6_STRHE|nr:Ribosomal protein L31 [Striga hermonthica]